MYHLNRSLDMVMNLGDLDELLAINKDNSRASGTHSTTTLPSVYQPLDTPTIGATTIPNMSSEVWHASYIHERMQCVISQYTVPYGFLHVVVELRTPHPHDAVVQDDGAVQPIDN